MVRYLIQDRGPHEVRGGLEVTVCQLLDGRAHVQGVKPDQHGGCEGGRLGQLYPSRIERSIFIMGQFRRNTNTKLIFPQNLSIMAIDSKTGSLLGCCVNVEAKKENSEESLEEALVHYKDPKFKKVDVVLNIFLSLKHM